MVILNEFLMQVGLFTRCVPSDKIVYRTRRKGVVDDSGPEMKGLIRVTIKELVDRFISSMGVEDDEAQ